MLFFKRIRLWLYTIISLRMCNNGGVSAFYWYKKGSFGRKTVRQALRKTKQTISKRIKVHKVTWDSNWKFKSIMCNSLKHYVPYKINYNLRILCIIFLYFLGVIRVLEFLTKFIMDLLLAHFSKFVIVFYSPHTIKILLTIVICVI